MSSDSGLPSGIVHRHIMRILSVNLTEIRISPWAHSSYAPAILKRVHVYILDPVALSRAGGLVGSLGTFGHRAATARDGATEEPMIERVNLSYDAAGPCATYTCWAAAVVVVS
jgi:hypothetical protein